MHIKFVIGHPGRRIFEGYKGLHLDRSLQHLEEDEAEEDKKHRNKEVLQPVPCSVCVRHMLIIFNTYWFSADQQLYSSQQHYVTFTLPFWFIFPFLHGFSFVSVKRWLNLCVLVTV